MSDAATYGPEWRIRQVLETPDVPFKMHGVTITVPHERKFGHIDTVRKYVEHVCTSEGFSVPAVVESKKLKNRAYYEPLGVRITMPNFDKARWAWREIVVLHEIAHHMQPFQGHSDPFQKTFADLLGKYIGSEIGWAYSVLRYGA